MQHVFPPSHKVLSSEMIHLGFLSRSLCLYFLCFCSYSWSSSCFGIQECLDLCLLVLWVSRFIFYIKCFCCWSFFHLCRFLFNFESSCVWLFTQLPPPKAMYTLLSISDPCLYFLPGCFFILFSHWFLCSPDYLVLTWFSYFVFIIASAISVSKFFYW